MAQPYPQPSSLPPPAPPPRRDLPLGVAILAVLVGLYGFLLFIVGLAVILLSTVLSGAVPSYLTVPAFGLTGLVLGIVILVIGLIILGIGVGLWRLRLWALVLGLLFLLYELVSYGIAGQFVSLGFILALVIFVYLLAVNRHFR